MSGGDVHAALSQLDDGGSAPLSLLATVDVALEAHWFDALSAEWHRHDVVVRLLHRIDRIAVVAPQRWIRAAARIEALLLPGIDYRVFTPADAAVARAWLVETPRT